MAQCSVAKIHASVVTVVTTVATGVGGGRLLAAEAALVEPVAHVAADDPGREVRATENPAAEVMDRTARAAFDHGGATELGPANPEPQQLVQSEADPEVQLLWIKLWRRLLRPRGGSRDCFRPIRTCQ